ncbi:SDR family NAD(P)-dependent oxidoreductase [Streptomyces millisiae]|uniref:SDR family NAD(P)-dependent oxidoreductase n=1 Tax=Streptomyces millisiae TaxID=3075542 RepID=A0ABU2LY87_9ACTN|nr:SDR family NAD(P)-dependent oxidoreductase [Streptomyces sp. DSM 44918]MDT0322569.1 SDR family NAD(P)-dependent oxidoreductase [Streptomyces sp. DSM 44918]
MTGATKGIGRVAVERVVAGAPDARLVLLGRGPATTALAAELSAGGAQVSSIDADLLSLRSVRHAAEQVRARLDEGELPPLRTLVANAGAQFTNDLTESAEGFEATFAVNVLANHVLVRHLQDRFAVPSRIVVTVSDTHFGDFRHNLGMVPAPRWGAPETLARVRAFPAPHTTAAGRTAYSTSKLAAIHLVHEYARRLPPGVDVVGYNPRFVPGTGLARDAGPAARFAMRSVLPLMTLTPFATSRTTAGRHLADLALGRIEAPSGSYVDHAKVARSSDESYDPARERELWDAVERLTTPRQGLPPSGRARGRHPRRRA